VCNILVSKCTIGIWVSIYNWFVTNLSIEKCLTPYNYPDSPFKPYHSVSMSVSVHLYLYVCISHLYTKFSHSSIDYHIIVKGIQQAWSWWTHDREVMVMILPYRLFTQLQHSNTVDNHENTSVILVDIPHTEIRISHQFITNSVWPLATPLLLIQFCRFSMLHLFYTVQSSQIRGHSCIVSMFGEVIFRGTSFHSDSPWSILPIPRVS